jgi:glycosyltransferase involved in cell wall biosynthesis
VGLRGVSGERISVVVTSYNQKPYLIEAVDSVLAQTRPVHEIVVVDDASVDGSQEVIRALESRHRGHVIGLFHERNSGIPRARTAGARRASGDLVGILDGDDRLLPGFANALTRRLDDSPGAGCVYGNLHLIDAAGRRIGERDADRQPEGDILRHVAKGAMGLLRSLLVRREQLEAAGFLDERFPKFDGFVLTLRLARATRFAYVPEPIAEYRVHAAGDSRGIRPAEMVLHLEAVWHEVERVCAGLSRGERVVLQKAWSRRLLQWSIESDLAGRQRLRAAFRLFAATLRDPAVAGITVALLRARFRARPVPLGLR